VRSLRAGQAMIVVSAGGWRADSLAITVDARSARTVFHDDFESERLDTKWQVFGSPRPYVAARIGVSNSRGFVSNGDDYLESGVVSRASFSPWNGLTIELSARSPDKWKTHHLLGVMLGSIKLDSVTIATGGIFTPEFKTVATLQMVGGLQGMGPEVRLGYTVLSGWPLDGKWHRIALQVRPDGYQELYIDGRFWGESTPDPNGLTPARLVLGFRSHGTMLVHDSVTVYEGLKYFH
jgi:hypothetical protein